MTCVLDNPYVLIVDGRLTTVKELLPILEAVGQHKQNHYLL